MAHKRRSVIAVLPDGGLHIDNRLYGVYLTDPAHRDTVALSLLSTFATLCREIYGRANFGQGMLDMKVYEAEALPVLDPTHVGVAQAGMDAIEPLLHRRILMLYDDVRQADRIALDDLFLRIVGFPDDEERAAVLHELQDAACRMIWARLAKSGNARESRMTFDEWLASGEPFDLDLRDEDEV